MAVHASTIDFLAKNNDCGKSLLKLVSRGNAIIAELLRLSDRVPPIFINPTGLMADLLQDFSYFKTSDLFDKKLEDSQLQDLDEEVRETHIDLLLRFFRAFESIHGYVTDLTKYIEDLESGFFLQQNLESVFLNTDGKQLLCEALYLYGVMLLAVDARIDGVVRERLLVAYSRFSARRSALDSAIDDVCALLRSTGYSRKSAKRPPNYPEDYFKRVPINQIYVGMTIGRLRSDDLYNQISAFPHPEQRSTALAPQAAMLYVCLYFMPEILQKQTPVVREIVDKFFPDNWVLSVYMGLTVNLIEAWEPYRAAKIALQNSLDEDNIKHTASKQGKELKVLKSGLEKFLSEGTMTKEYILDNTSRLLNSLRRCNVTLRWLMLHTSALKSEWKNVKKCAQMRDMVINESNFQSLALFDLLLSTSQFELKLKEKLKNLLEEKYEKCDQLRIDIADRFGELVEVYSGNKPLSRVQKNEKLQAWFADIKTQIEKLDFKHELEATGRKLVQMCARLTEVRDLHSLDTHINVRQFLLEIQQLMQLLLRILNIKEDNLVQIQIIGDLTYAWEIVDQFTPLMQEGIKKNPDLAIKLRATFLKLSSALDLPLLRIQQSNSLDLVSVSQFYSRELVLYVRKVLQVIPESVFSLLSQIVKLQTNRIRELPARLDKDKMKEFANLDDRYEMARLTHAISVLTEGILMMKTTLVGIIKVDPKQVLEDGIRKELVRQVATAMHQTLRFNYKSKQSDLVAKLGLLTAQIDGFRRSFAYISDYISLCGLRIWQEEFSRIIGYNVEQECNSFLKHKITEEESIYQSKMIPIPKFSPTDNNFVGRLVNEIIKETDYKNTIYIPSLGTWFDAKTKSEKVNPQLFKLLIASISNIGVSGLDRLCCFMIVNSLQQFVHKYGKQIVENTNMAAFFPKAVENLSTEKLIEQPNKFYDSLTQKPHKIFPDFADLIAKVGQIQLLRLHFVREVAKAAKFESKLLEEMVQTLNLSILTDIEGNSVNHTNPYPKDDNPLLYELSQYLDACGITDPLKKIYICPPKLSHFSCFTFLLTLWLCPKLTYVKNVGLLSKKPTDSSDGIPLIIGLVTLLQQFNHSQTLSFFDFIAKYVNSFVRASLKTPASKPTELATEVIVMLKFVTEFSHFAGISQKELKSVIPPSLIEQYHACLGSV